MRIFRKLLALLLVGLAGFGSTGSSTYAQTPRSGLSGDIVRVDQAQIGPGFVQHPLYLKVLGRNTHGTAIFSSSTKPASALGADAISKYLSLSNDGAGQTIAIVDAYDNPNIESDLNYFSNAQNLPVTCSSGQSPSNCFNFTKIYAQGSQPKTDAGWALEIALDVEWAHAVAPKANIVLVEAASNSNTNLFDAIRVAAGSGAVVISNSWGGGEFSGESTYDSSCANVLCVFSSGDSGNPGGYPAYNPYVIAVGGTTLMLASDGTPTSEVAWSGSGGGLSQYEARPAYQDGVNPYNNRGMPDVSYDADPNTGFQVYDTVRYHGFSGWFQVGGTSAGAPQWAAIIAAADQTRSVPLSPVNFDASLALYGSSVTSNLYDITSGSNGNCGSICQASVGYDFVTGLGSPRSGIDVALAGGSTSNSSSLIAAFTVTCNDTTLTCNFDASGSSNSTTTYAWDFGDSSSLSTKGSTTSHTYGNGGSYLVTLTVTDDTGGQGTTTQTVSVGTTPVTTTVSVSSIGYSTSGPHGKDLDISVSVVDSSSKPVANADVSIQVDLNGSAYGTATGTTNTSGVASFTARNAPSGTYTTAITDISGNGLTWDGSWPTNSYTK